MSEKVNKIHNSLIFWAAIAASCKNVGQLGFHQRVLKYLVLLQNNFIIQILYWVQTRHSLTCIMLLDIWPKTRPKFHLSELNYQITIKYQKLLNLWWLGGYLVHCYWISHTKYSKECILCVSWFTTYIWSNFF